LIINYYHDYYKLMNNNYNYDNNNDTHFNLTMISHLDLSNFIITLISIIMTK